MSLIPLAETQQNLDAAESLENSGSGPTCDPIFPRENEQKKKESKWKKKEKIRKGTKEKAIGISGKSQKCKKKKKSQNVTKKTQEKGQKQARITCKKDPGRRRRTSQHISRVFDGSLISYGKGTDGPSPMTQMVQACPSNVEQNDRSSTAERMTISHALLNLTAAYQMLRLH